MDKVNAKELGDYIRQLREARDLSLRSVAREADIAPSGLSDIENGRRIPTPDTLQRLAEALGIDYEDLYAVSGISRPEKLPELDAYLRTRYAGELTAADRRSLERYFDELRGKKRGRQRGN